MGLTEENRKDVVLYRIERAFTALKQAKGNFRMGYLEVTANRLYYAAYYAASALLIAHGIATHSHDGTITQFGMHFAKTGALPRDFGRLFNGLFSMRLTGDYCDRFDLTQEEVSSKILPAEEFVAEVCRLAKEKVGLSS